VWGRWGHACTQWWILCARAFWAGRGGAGCPVFCTVSLAMTRPCHLANCSINTDFIWLADLIESNLSEADVWARWHEMRDSSRPCDRPRVREGFGSAGFPLRSSVCAAHVIKDALVRSVRRRATFPNDHNHTVSTKHRRFQS